jgi:hypothetical protein
MLPEFTDDGLLPPGIHRATVAEFKQRFAVFTRSDRRWKILEKIDALLTEAGRSGIVRRVLVAGSYVTAKPEPNDFDCILVLDPSIVGAALPPFQYNLVSRKTARRMFGGDIMPALEGSTALAKYLEFFQTTREGWRAGIVEIEL